MAEKLLIFTGAPLASSLDWNDSVLLRSPRPPFTLVPNPESDSAQPVPSQPRTHAAWRSLPLRRPHLPTGFSQPHGFPSDEEEILRGTARFFTTADADFSDDDEGGGDATADSLDGSRLLTQLCDQSLALLDGDDDVSQPVLNDSFASSTTTDPSFLSTTGLSHSTALQPPPQKPPLGNPATSWHLSDLEDIPPASYLARLPRPQTVTVNLIVGVVDVPPPREVVARRGGGGGRTVSLVELLVGDDTRSGFAVTLWLGTERAREVVGRLRKGDVVLLQDVALSVFRERVYGQSLRGDRTKIHLLYRGRTSGDGERGYYGRRDLVVSGDVHPQVEKTKRVRDWVLAFVAGEGSGLGGRVGLRSWERVPDDTQ